MLQLETQLEQERVRLGELRKRHYVLGGPGANGGDEDADSFPPPPPPTLLDSSPELQSLPQAQPYLNTQCFPPINPFTPAPTQPYLRPQPHTYSQSHMYTPPAQSFAPPQTFPSSRPYIPAQPILLNPSQNYFSPQTNLLSQTPSSTSGRAHSPSLSKKSPQNNTEAGKSSSKKPNIFTKSGNLLKNAVSAGYSFARLNQIKHVYASFFFSRHSSRKMKVEREQSLEVLTQEDQYKQDTFMSLCYLRLFKVLWVLDGVTQSLYF